MATVESSAIRRSTSVSQNCGEQSAIGRPKYKELNAESQSPYTEVKPQNENKNPPENGQTLITTSQSANSTGNIAPTAHTESTQPTCGNCIHLESQLPKALEEIIYLKLTTKQENEKGSTPNQPLQIDSGTDENHHNLKVPVHTHQSKKMSTQRETLSEDNYMIPTTNHFSVLYTEPDQPTRPTIQDPSTGKMSQSIKKSK